MRPTVNFTSGFFGSRKIALLDGGDRFARLVGGILGEGGEAERGLGLAGARVGLRGRLCCFDGGGAIPLCGESQGQPDQGGCETRSSSAARL